jgi:hypothetical protein
VSVPVVSRGGAPVAAPAVGVKDRGVSVVIEEFWPGRRGDAFDERCPG